MRRLVTLFLVVLLLGASAGPVLAQTETVDEPPAGATATAPPMPAGGPTPASATHVTGSVVEDRHLSRDTRSYVNGALIRWGSEFETTYRWSDPRLPETGWSIRNLNFYALEPGIWTGSVWTGTMRLDGADGAWVGPMTGLKYADGRVSVHARLSGEGAYEHLAAILDITGEGAYESLDEEVIDGPLLTGSIEGFIVDKLPPPIDEPL